MSTVKIWKSDFLQLNVDSLKITRRITEGIPSAALQSHLRVLNRSALNFIMNTDLFVVCEDATIDESGKSTITGTFNEVRCAKFPTTYTYMIAGILRYTDEEVGVHKVEVKIIDDDGEEIGKKYDKELDFPLPYDDNYEDIKRVFLKQINQPFLRPGRHSIQILVDSKLIASVPLYMLSSP